MLGLRLLVLRLRLRVAGQSQPRGNAAEGRPGQEQGDRPSRAGRIRRVAQQIIEVTVVHRPFLLVEHPRRAALEPTSADRLHRAGVQQAGVHHLCQRVCVRRRLTWLLPAKLAIGSWGTHENQ